MAQLMMIPWGLDRICCKDEVPFSRKNTCKWEWLHLASLSLIHRGIYASHPCSSRHQGLRSPGSQKGIIPIEDTTRVLLHFNAQLLLGLGAPFPRKEVTILTVLMCLIIWRREGCCSTLVHRSLAHR